MSSATPVYLGLLVNSLEWGLAFRSGVGGLLTALSIPPLLARIRAVAYANGGKLRVRTDQEQQLGSECSRLLANCIIYYNACILSELLERAERRQDYQRADAIKRANPASWKHVNLYGAYSFLDIGDGVDLQGLVNLLEAACGRCAAAPD